MDSQPFGTMRNATTEIEIVVGLKQFIYFIWAGIFILVVSQFIIAYLFEFDEAKAELERKFEVKSEKLRKLTAFHESGHALVAIHADGALPIDKVTIVSQGMALGMVVQLRDNDDEMLMTRRQMLAELEVYMGGRAAEELIFGENEVTSGASSDIQEATSLAIDMITKYGMSLKIGLVYYDDYEEGTSTLSAETRSLIENEVKELLEKAYKNAKNILATHQEELHALANALLKHETLSGSQIKKLLDKKKKTRKKSRKHLIR